MSFSRWGAIQIYVRYFYLYFYLTLSLLAFSLNFCMFDLRKTSVLGRLFQSLAVLGKKD